MLQYRSCTNPVPSLGGKPCWSSSDANDSNQALKLSTEWPVVISSTPCDSCPNKAPEDEDTCQYSTTWFSTEANDFQQCEIGGGDIGRCVIGSCIRIANKCSFAKSQFYLIYLLLYSHLITSY